MSLPGLRHLSSSRHQQCLMYPEPIMRAAPLRLITMILLLAPFSSTRAQNFTDIKPTPSKRPGKTSNSASSSTSPPTPSSTASGATAPPTPPSSTPPTSTPTSGCKPPNPPAQSMSSSSPSTTTASPSGPPNKPTTASRTAHGSTAKATSSAWPPTPPAKHGLGFGVYLSPWDRHDPRYKDPTAYDKYYLAQLDELATNYGDLVEFWLDGAGSAGHVYDFDKIIQELCAPTSPTPSSSPTSASSNTPTLRWVGTESGTVPYENWNVIDRARLSPLATRRSRHAAAQASLVLASQRRKLSQHPSMNSSTSTPTPSAAAPSSCSASHPTTPAASPTPT